MTATDHTPTTDWQHALAIIQGSDDAIVSKTIEGIITSWNPGAERLFGYSAKEAIGQSILMLFPENRIPEEAMLLGRIKAGERLKNFETVRRCKDGRFIHVSVTLSPILDAHGQVTGVSKIARDITERKRLEWLETEKQRAERATEARTTLLANVSHELRTPMNVILGHTQLLQQTALSSEQSTQLQTVHESATFMLRLVNDLLDVAQLDQGTISLELSPFELMPLLTEVTTTYQAMAAAKGLTFTSTLSQWSSGLQVRSDPLRVRQILTNLISNAVKFTREGSIALRFELKTDKLVCHIADTGVGMNQADIHRLFQPFSQADESNTRSHGGAGLGAAIAKQLVDVLGGKLSVHSQANVGTTVDVELPMPICHPVTHPPRTSPETPAPLHPLRVLAVDDNPLNLRLLSAILNQQGHQVTAVDSGAAALDAIAAHAFDVVLMDVQMPGMTGLEATRHIRQLETKTQRQATPVIAVTASVLMSDQEAATQAGMDGFVGKPIKISVLNAEIARVVQAPGSQPNLLPGWDTAKPNPAPSSSGCCPTGGFLP